MRKLVGWLALIAFLVAALAACGEPTLDEKGTAEAFLKAMESRDFLAAHELLSADSQATISSEEFKNMLDKAWESAGISGFELISVQDPVLSTTGTRASVPYSAKLITNDGESVVVYNALSIVEQDGHWRVIWPPTH
jgi:hypothetical protein